MCQCTFGVAPSTLNILPTNRVLCGALPAGNIMDFAPIMNIAPFGMCSSAANPTVAAATAAALGVLTPMPCVPVTTPWIPSSPTVMIGTGPALNMGDKTMCTWGGMITIVTPGQFTVV
ncbi:MAG: DUF4280 domain-containing protein [Holosporales bacterium]|nr:DUF4280 domain-containing protein [Holosporales bacterium]